MTLRSRLVSVALIIVGLIVVGMIVAVFAQQQPISIGEEGASAGAGPLNINAVVVIGQTGTIRYVAAGTSRGLRIYELRRVGMKYQVTDVTKE